MGKGAAELIHAGPGLAISPEQGSQGQHTCAPGTRVLGFKDTRESSLASECFKIVCTHTGKERRPGRHSPQAHAHSQAHACADT